MKKLSVTMSRKEMLAGLIYIAVQVLFLPVIIVVANMIFGSPFSEVQLNFIVFAIDFICVTVIFYRFLLGNLKTALANPMTVLKCIGLGFLLYWGGNIIVSMIISTLQPDFFNVNDASLSQLTKDNFALMAIGTVILVPVTEETLYRGVVFGNLYRKNPVLGFVVSVIVFALLHVIGYIGLYKPMHLLLCFLQYIPAGACLAFAYVKSDTIITPILMHMTINLLGVFAMR